MTWISWAGMAAFLVILCVAAWQDLRERSVDSRFLMVSGVVGAAYALAAERGGREIGLSCAIGGGLLALSILTRGQIGEGDGWFFVISGLFFDVRENLLLFVLGLVGCFLFSLCLAVGALRRRAAGRRRGIPFLPFLVPWGIWLAGIPLAIH